MKTKPKRIKMTFGDFIAAAYRTWGVRRAKGLVWLAVNARLVVFQGRQRFVISEEQHENSSAQSNAV
jgi:G3E family GTPase